MAKFRLPLLKEILSQPTAPYREEHVAALIEAKLAAGKVPFFEDPHGNIIVGVSSKREYQSLLAKKSAEPLRIYMAHMDHPGFHGAKWLADGTLEVQWYGGTPVKYLENYPVWLASARGWEGEGTLVSVTLAKTGRSADRSLLKLDQDLRRFHRNPKELFGGFRFRAPVWEEGELLYTKAADDLVGVFGVVSLALDLFSKKTKAPFLGILTRAEETGWIGALAHWELGWHKNARRPLLLVSLETSRTLPGAEIGKGPIVRTGDRFTVFNPGALRIFLEVAEKLAKGKYQSRIMDGGSCEASAASLYGIPAVGISIPLGNYHNTGLEGGPDSGGPMGPAPEFVHKKDVEGMITLCHGLLKPRLSWTDPWKKKRVSLSKHLAQGLKLLKA